MKQVVIENPVINSPFKEPNRHFRFTEEGITDEIVDTRRVSAYFIPIAFTLGVPSMNNHSGFRIWSFLEITDTRDAKNVLRRFLEKLKEHSYDQR